MLERLLAGAADRSAMHIRLYSPAVRLDKAHGLCVPLLKPRSAGRLLLPRQGEVHS